MTMGGMGQLVGNLLAKTSPHPQQPVSSPYINRGQPFHRPKTLIHSHSTVTSRPQRSLNMLFFIASCFTLMAVGQAGNYTVTEEAWFDVEVQDMDGPGQDYRGRFTIALFGDSAPMTSMNFAAITKGYKKGKDNLHYKNTPIHRIVPDFVIQMGDITVGDGTGGRSIFGERFNDEEFILSHRSPGWVAMANHGPDTNGSQFYILLTKARWLDNKHVVFGKVVRGMDVVKTIGEAESDPNTAIPKNRVRIIDCGVNDVTKYDLTADQLDSTDDL